MLMKLSKIYNPREMNSYQFLAATGLVMTVVAHIILAIIGKTVENFAALYLCWVVFFGAGTIANYRSKPDDHHHHHHH
jgi:intracellular septation protein A